jgi:hypothetical protein
VCTHALLKQPQQLLLLLLHHQTVLQAAKCHTDATLPAASQGFQESRVLRCHPLQLSNARAPWHSCCHALGGNAAHHIGNGHQQARPDELDKPIDAERHLNDAAGNSLAVHAGAAYAVAAVVLLLLPHPWARHELLLPPTS